MKTPRNRIKNMDGSIINMALSMLLLLSAMGISATTTATDDVKIASNYKYDRQAFFAAFSGVQYGLAQMEYNLRHNVANFNLPTRGTETTLNYTVPQNFSFGLSAIAADPTDTNLYSFTAVGAGPKNASAAIKVAFKRGPAVNYAAFGETLVDLKANGGIYSYNSRANPHPTPINTGNNGDVGSNKEVRVKNGTMVNGDVVLGKQTDGTDGYITDLSGAAVYGGPVNIERVHPDPLGVVGGEYADKFTNCSVSNANNLANPPIVGNAIALGNGETLTLVGKSGGANYYVNSIDLADGASLLVDATTGPVIIFLAGALDVQHGAIVDVNGRPTDFTVFSNSDKLISIKHGGIFKGLVYAPYATVELRNSVDLYGAIWANIVDLTNSGDIYFDAALTDDLLTKSLNVLSWRQLY